MQAGSAPSVSAMVIETAVELGATNPESARTTMITRGGFCIGRRYRFDRVVAIWLLDDGVVRFYGEDHDLLKTLPIRR